MHILLHIRLDKSAMDGFFHNLQPIIGVTINTVSISPHFIIFLYLLFLVSSLSWYFYFKHRGKGHKYSLRISILSALLITAIAYSVNSAAIWLHWLKEDWRAYRGLNTEEKLLKMEYPLYDFASRLKKLIPEDSTYTLYSSDEYLSRRLEYFLLPRKKKEASEFIIVLLDRDTVFDPFKKIMKRGETVITNLEPFFLYTEDAYMVRRR